MTAELECLLDDVLTGRQEMTGAVDAVCDSARRIIGRLGERGADAEDVMLGGADGGGGDQPPTAKMRKFAASIAKSKGIKPPGGYTKSAAICRAFLDEHAPRRNVGQGEPKNSGGGTAGTASRAAKPRKAGADRPGTGSPTPLRIPYGNKEAASAWAPDTGRMAGMRRLAWISRHSASGDGCNGGSMRVKRPRPASPDQVRIAREGETAVIEYADPSVRVVNLQVGPSLGEMSDAVALELFNGMLEAQAGIAAGVDPTLTEIPPGLPQIEYNERSDQWVPRGQVLRCHIDDDAEAGTIIQIDELELDMAAFGRMLQVFSGFGMRIAFVDEEEVTDQPEILVREPDDD